MLSTSARYLKRREFGLRKERKKVNEKREKGWPDPLIKGVEAYAFAVFALFAVIVVQTLSHSPTRTCSVHEPLIYSYGSQLFSGLAGNKGTYEGLKKDQNSGIIKRETALGKTLEATLPYNLRNIRTLKQEPRNCPLAMKRQPAKN